MSDDDAKTLRVDVNFGAPLFTQEEITRIATKMVESIHGIADARGFAQTALAQGTAVHPASARLMGETDADLRRRLTDGIHELTDAESKRLAARFLEAGIVLVFGQNVRSFQYEWKAHRIGGQATGDRLSFGGYLTLEDLHSSARKQLNKELKAKGLGPLEYEGKDAALVRAFTSDLGRLGWSKMRIEEVVEGIDRGWRFNAIDPDGFPFERCLLGALQNAISLIRGELIVSREMVASEIEAEAKELERPLRFLDGLE